MKLNAICVYCGSSAGNSEVIQNAARELGAALASRGISLVYGGGNVGLMGLVADAALGAGGTVVGVITEGLMEREVGHRGLKELHIVKTMHQRKAMMAGLADGFIAMPGGIGTFDELFEVLTWSALKIHDKPVGLLNAGGFYDPLVEFLKSACEKGFMRESQLAGLLVSASPGELLDLLEAGA